MDQWEAWQIRVDKPIRATCGEDLLVRVPSEKPRGGSAAQLSARYTTPAAAADARIAVTFPCPSPIAPRQEDDRGLRGKFHVPSSSSEGTEYREYDEGCPGSPRGERAHASIRAPQQLLPPLTPNARFAATFRHPSAPAPHIR